MIRWRKVLLLLIGGVLLALAGARAWHEQDNRPVWRALRQPVGPAAFQPALVDDLPAPARAFLLHAIAAGTPLARSVQLSMHGSILLSPGQEPFPMRAEQMLAPPHGFVWRARVGRGFMHIGGHDRFHAGAGEMRWWLWGLLPIVHATGTDVSRSAAGRLVMEAVLVPATLLPGPGVHWEEVDQSRARFSMTAGGETVVATITVTPDGSLRHVSAMRWHDGTNTAEAGYVRFDVELDNDRTFQGYTLPTRIRAGWRLGEHDEYPFFWAELSEAVFR
jgi:hypothetical protein